MSGRCRVDGSVFHIIGPEMRSFSHQVVVNPWNNVFPVVRGASNDDDYDYNQWYQQLVLTREQQLLRQE